MKIKTLVSIFFTVLFLVSFSEANEVVAMYDLTEKPAEISSEADVDLISLGPDTDKGLEYDVFIIGEGEVIIDKFLDKFKEFEKLSGEAKTLEEAIAKNLKELFGE